MERQRETASYKIAVSLFNTKIFLLRYPVCVNPAAPVAEGAIPFVSAYEGRRIRLFKRGLILPFFSFRFLDFVPTDVRPTCDSFSPIGIRGDVPHRRRAQRRVLRNAPASAIAAPNVVF